MRPRARKSFKAPDGRELPLAFEYRDVAYYFDMDGYDDSATTIAISVDGIINGIQANEMLVNAIHDYGNNRRSRVYIAPFFNDCVAFELSEIQQD